jgi:glycosyltransferase involved in cell wall biosynthesis
MKKLSIPEVSQLPIAIVYDRVNKFGGAERVLLALKEAFPNSVLCTSVYAPTAASWVGNWMIHTSFLQKIPFFRTRHEKAALLMPFAFETLDVSSFPIVISITSEFAKAVVTRTDQLHVCYCLTPTRYLWSHTHLYAGKRFGWLRQFFFSSLRHKDFVAATRPDTYIAISTFIQSRIEKYYRRPVHSVIYPPVEIVDQTTTSLQRSFFLVVSRLVEYKKIEIAIRACIQADVPLVIVGTGSDRSRLEQVAGGDARISFTEFVSEEELSSYYRQAIALLCPQEEDFGIVSVEAQSYGTPVISYAHSGVAETIVENKTGLLVEDQHVESFVRAILAANTTTWNHDAIAMQAKKFEKELFISSFQETISKLYHNCLNRDGVE